MSEPTITVVGAGLAGCEAAWQAANRGIHVELFEMKPKKLSPAHHSNNYAELVCSNSLRADRLENAVGLLKEEMRKLNSVIIKAADETRVPAGGALAVDREGFSQTVTSLIKNHPLINVSEKEVTEIPEGNVIIASGPLTSDSLSEAIAKLTGAEYLHFFDAAAPIVEFDTINLQKAYFAARYGRGTDDYINCPMTKEEYDAFYTELINAETAELKEFDKTQKVFEGCMPVEVMGKRGHDTLLFGPLKPVGLPDPKTGKEPYAVVQLRRDNNAGSLYNIVGFQTHLKWPEQKRVFSMIPGLENAEFTRYGVMHRNTYLDSPALLDCYYRLKTNPKIFFAGQMTGVEGYVESASSGLSAGINCARILEGKEPVDFTAFTAIGALSHYISGGEPGRLQPMNVNFGIMPSLDERIRNKAERYRKISERALTVLDDKISLINN